MLSPTDAVLVVENAHRENALPRAPGDGVKLAAMIRLAALFCLLLATPVMADERPEKYRLMDEARIAVVRALDTKDVEAFAKLVGPDLRTQRLWFDTPACRKKFASARVTAKQHRAFVDCFAPLGVTQRGLLVLVGPGVMMTPTIEVHDGKATVTKLSGVDTRRDNQPEVFFKIFESNRVAGDANLVLDDAAREELAAMPSGLAAFSACVDKTGAVAKHELLDIAPKGALAKTIAAGVRTWKFKPFEMRGKPIGACAVVLLRANRKS